MTDLTFNVFLGLQQPLDIFYVCFYGSFAFFLGAGIVFFIFSCIFIIAKYVTKNCDL